MVHNLTAHVFILCYPDHSYPNWFSQLNVGEERDGAIAFGLMEGGAKMVSIFHKLSIITTAFKQLKG